MTSDAMKRALATRTADTDWKPATTVLQYRIEIINGSNPNRPTWVEGIGFYYIIDSRTDLNFERQPSQKQRDTFWYGDLDEAIKICDAINEFGRWGRSHRSPSTKDAPIVARVIVFTQQETRGVVYDGKAPEPHPVDLIDDQVIRNLVEAKDVGSARARLKSLWPS